MAPTTSPLSTILTWASCTTGCPRRVLAARGYYKDVSQSRWRYPAVLNALGSGPDKVRRNSANCSEPSVMARSGDMPVCLVGAEAVRRPYSDDWMNVVYGRLIYQRHFHVFSFEKLLIHWLQYYLIGIIKSSILTFASTICITVPHKEGKITNTSKLTNVFWLGPDFSDGKRQTDRDTKIFRIVFNPAFAGVFRHPRLAGGGGGGVKRPHVITRERMAAERRPMRRSKALDETILKHPLNFPNEVTC